MLHIMYLMCAGSNAQCGVRPDAGLPPVVLAMWPLSLGAFSYWSVLVVAQVCSDVCIVKALSWLAFAPRWTRMLLEETIALKGSNREW